MMNLTKMMDDYNQAQLHGAELANQNALEQAQTRYDDAVAALRRADFFG